MVFPGEYFFSLGPTVWSLEQIKCLVLGDSHTSSITLVFRVDRTKKHVGDCAIYSETTVADLPRTRKTTVSDISPATASPAHEQPPCSGTMILLLCTFCNIYQLFLTVLTCME